MDNDTDSTRKSKAVAVSSSRVSNFFQSADNESDRSELENENDFNFNFASCFLEVKEKKKTTERIKQKKIIYIRKTFTVL